MKNQLLKEKNKIFNDDIKILEERLNDSNLYEKNAQEFNLISNNIGAKRGELDILENKWLELEELKNS